MERFAHPISLKATDVGCDRVGEPVVRGVSFMLRPGNAIQLFGPNGSGKSSLLSMFAGVIEHADGDFEWQNENKKSSKPFDGSLFFLGHETSLKLALTAEENLKFWAGMYGVRKKLREVKVREALAVVGASEFSGVRTIRLSAGQRRRIDLARAVIADRPVWLMDEPAAAIDTDGVTVISQMIGGHMKRGGIAIVATHDDLGPNFHRLELGR